MKLELKKLTAGLGLLALLFVFTNLPVAANPTGDRDGDGIVDTCLLYTSPSPRDATLSRMPSSA